MTKFVITWQIYNMKKKEEKTQKFDAVIQKAYMLILSDALSSRC